MPHSNKEFTVSVTSPLADTGQSANVVGTIYDSAGAVVSTLTFTEPIAKIYHSPVTLPRGVYTLIVTAPWEVGEIVEHINVTDQPLTTVEYLGMRG